MHSQLSPFHSTFSSQLIHIECTFIVAANTKQVDNFDPSVLVNLIVGDVNLYFNDPENPKCCEIEVMIAEKEFRRQGYGGESLILLMGYAVEKLGVQRFYAKISEKNEASIALFKNLQFQRCNYVEAFQEYEYEYIVTPEAKEAITQSCLDKFGYKELIYDPCITLYNGNYNSDPRPYPVDEN